MSAGAPSQVAVILEFHAKEGRGPDLVRWLEENLPDTRSFAGCGGVEAYTDPARPEVVTLIEYWPDREAHAAYSAWRATTETRAALIEVLAAPPAPRYVDHFPTD